MAREDYGRDTGIMTYGYLICRDTEQEARKARDLMMEHADWGAANNVLSVLGVLDSRTPRRPSRCRSASSSAGAAIRSSARPSRSPRRSLQASDAGIDGVVFGLLDFAEELGVPESALLPLMREAGCA